MRTLKLPRLVSNGMILQQKKKARIWGWDEPGRRVTVSFLSKEYGGRTDKEGKWEVFLTGLLPGGPYSMTVCDDAGSREVIEDILIGDVWLCSGQSNMELPISRVRDRYPEETANCDNAFIRTFKITEHSDFHGPLKELLSGEWKQAQAETIPDFSATAYFFARQMYGMTGVPVGLINASLGGSRIESWMSREMLEGYEDFLALADRYSDDEFVGERIRQNEQNALQWHGRLDSMDPGLKENWERSGQDVSLWKEIEIPCFFKDTELKGFIGSVWFRREFTVSGKLAGKQAKLWLGTIVDSDTVYVNGIQVGHTDYQYPPRKYTVPEGLLKEGKNVIVIRVKCDIGQGRFTDGKVYALFNEEESVELSGRWRYRIGAACEMVPETDFVNWKPTGLYNAMTAPCHFYTIAGIIWYQGEANTRSPESYLDLMERMIKGYRRNWGEEELPFIYVQLPNFKTELYDSDRDETFSDWPGIRESQRQALKIPGTGMAVAIDLGEDNDLHPLNKKDIGFRLAMEAAAKLYGVKSQCGGPEIEEIRTEKETDENGNNRWKAVIECSNATGGVYAFSENKGKEIRDFELVDEKGVLYPAQAEILENKIILTGGEDADNINEIRYCYRNTNQGALIYNTEGFPMSPFRISIPAGNESGG